MHRWASLGDEALLDMRMADLDLHIRGTILEERIARLYRELEERRIRLRPHCWLGEEWFAADGVPGIAIPFYLAHPRLMDLERRQMLAVEGGPQEECLRILRHEAGHTLESAFRLNRRREWREIFGRASKRYPTHYRVRPSSRDFVLHLGSWYAQSHPSEDFAETFAVWLKPHGHWRRRYAGWPALEKLEYVDRLMRELADTAPPVRSRERVDPLPRLRITLREHYRRKQKAYAKSYPPVYDRALVRLFGEKPSAAYDESAAAFLRRNRRELIETVSSSLGVHPYVVDHLLTEMTLETRKLGLRRRRSETRTRLAAKVLLTIQTNRFLRADRHRMAL
jgi:hypothetical protein